VSSIKENPMRSIRTLLAAFALAGVAACGSGVEPTGDDTVGDDDDDTNPDGDEWDDLLDQRETDYSAALRIAALRLTGELPKLVEIKAVADAPAAQQADVYASLVQAYLDDPRFTRQMIAWWKDTLKLGDAAMLDSAAHLAAQITVEGRPYTDLLTAATGTCPTYDAGAGTFTAADCQNGVAVHAGLLTHPGMNAQFYSNMAFRRVRWVQETFACTAFPAELAEEPQDLGGAALYASPWPFTSIAGAQTGGRVDFHDLSAVACANCHSTMNHIAPLFLNFDDQGALQATSQVMLPVDGSPIAEPTDFLPAGEPTAWRLGVPTADLPALGAAMAADPAIAECAIARAWNWAMGKGDIVDTLTVVPRDVIAQQITDFTAGGLVYKDALFAVFTSDDFVKF
jgi:hypothetical protein